MAITSTGYSSPAISREGLVPSVYDGLILVGSEETPILSTLGTTNVSNTTHSWIIDTIGDPIRTPQMEVTNLVTTGGSTKQNNSNFTEIFKTEVFVSKTMSQVKSYGGNELEHEIAKKGKEHKKLLEQMILGLNRHSNLQTSLFKAPSRRSDSSPGEAAGLFYYMAKGNSGFKNGSRGNVLAFDSSKDWAGDTTVMTWDIFNEILQVPYNKGEYAKDIFVGANLKSRINSFVSRQYKDELTYVGRVVALETDFGTVNINLSRFMNASNGLENSIIVGNFDYAKVGLLYPTELADVPTDRTGLAKRFYTEATLEVRNADAFAAGVGLK